MTCVLVTGGYGRVGRVVVERLVADKFQVVVTTHKTVKPSLPVGVDVRPVDLRCLAVSVSRVSAPV